MTGAEQTRTVDCLQSSRHNTSRIPGEVLQTVVGSIFLTFNILVLATIGLAIPFCLLEYTAPQTKAVAFVYNRQAGPRINEDIKFPDSIDRLIIPIRMHDVRYAQLLRSAV